MGGVATLHYRREWGEWKLDKIDASKLKRE
jgi:hypothetical protein